MMATQTQWDLLTQWEADQEPEPEPLPHTDRETPVGCDWFSNQTLAKARAVCEAVHCPFKKESRHVSRNS